MKSYLYSCQHCKQFNTYSLDETVNHCKTCTYMPRPNPFKCKYVCYMCDYGAYQVDPLRAHICVHSGEKPFRCSYCLFACARQSNLLVHIKGKHPNELSKI
uniref:Zinc finger protein 711 n=1 Tax=Cacopsylla melanoneura TaxID=428564 RepID=A0A8D8YUZ8_9HEMI